jgi:hypothetical protein
VTGYAHPRSKTIAVGNNGLENQLACIDAEKQYRNRSLHAVLIVFGQSLNQRVGGSSPPRFTTSFLTALNTTNYVPHRFSSKLRTSENKTSDTYRLPSVATRHPSKYLQQSFPGTFRQVVVLSPISVRNGKHRLDSAQVDGNYMAWTKNGVVKKYDS